MIEVRQVEKAMTMIVLMKIWMRPKLMSRVNRPFGLSRRKEEIFRPKKRKFAYGYWKMERRVVKRSQNLIGIYSTICSNRNLNVIEIISI